jgi:uncharacterized membrane protein YesL
MAETIAHGVQLYWGAILILLGIVLAIMGITLLYRTHTFVRKSTRAVEYVGSSLLVPVMSLLATLTTGRKKTATKTSNE